MSFPRASTPDWVPMGNCCCCISPGMRLKRSVAGTTSQMWHLDLHSDWRESRRVTCSGWLQPTTAGRSAEKKPRRRGRSLPLHGSSVRSRHPLGSSGRRHGCARRRGAAPTQPAALRRRSASGRRFVFLLLMYKLPAQLASWCMQRGGTLHAACQKFQCRARIRQQYEQKGHA